jgi:putative endonuclease
MSERPVVFHTVSRGADTNSNLRHPNAAFADRLGNARRPILPSISMIARAMFAIVKFAARKGLADPAAPEPNAGVEPANAKKTRARRTGIRGETYAYWYLRRHGYIVVARNFTTPGIKGELDLVGYDGKVLAFVEVKTRALTGREFPSPEAAVTPDKRYHLIRTARQFLRARRAQDAPHRFDILAIESRKGQPPQVRLHKAAFSPE